MPFPPGFDLQSLFEQANRLSGAPVLLVVCLGSMLAVIVRDWRLALVAFMAVYLGLAVLTAQLLPAEWALLRVIVGGLAAIIWYLSAQRAGWGGRFLPFSHSDGVEARPLASTTLFRVLVALTLVAFIVVVRPRLPLPDLPGDLRMAATWLAAFGLLGLALGDEAFQTGLALLFWMSATQLLMAALQRDAWLIWLLSSAELLLALATGYLMIARGPSTRLEASE